MRSFISAKHLTIANRQLDITAKLANGIIPALLSITSFYECNMCSKFQLAVLISSAFSTRLITIWRWKLQVFRYRFLKRTRSMHDRKINRLFNIFFEWRNWLLWTTSWKKSRIWSRKRRLYFVILAKTFLTMLACMFAINSLYYFQAPIAECLATFAMLDTFDYKPSKEISRNMWRTFAQPKTM